MNPLINFLLTVPLFLCLQMNAQIIYVKQDASGTGSGDTWANAFTKLDNALAAALPGDQVWVAAGVYKPDTSISGNSHFALLTGIELYGGFTGTELSLSQRDPQTNITTLSGDLNDDDDPLDLTINRSDNSIHVLRVDKGDNTQPAIIDGLVIRNGNTKTIAINSDSIRGGGILATAKVTVSNCTFTENAGWIGGGIASFDTAKSNIIVYNCIFDNNYSAGQSAGIHISTVNSGLVSKCIFLNNTTKAGSLTIQGSSLVVIDSCLFENNRTLSAQRTAGLNISYSSFLLKNSVFRENSAAYSTCVHLDGLSNDTMTINNCLFEKNTSIGDGTGIYNFLSTNITVKNCVFREDTASNAAGIYNWGLGGTALVIDSCLFENNYADGSTAGGAVIHNRSATEISNSTFWGNVAVSNASAIYNQNCNVNVENSLFQYGVSNVLGAITNFGGNVRLENCDFNANDVNDASGGAVFNDNNVNAVITGCNFQNNAARWGGAICNNYFGTKVVINNCLFENNSATISGGAIFNQTGANLSILNTTLKDNTAASGGAIQIRDYNSNLTLQNTTFEANHATLQGGALNCFSGNTSNILKSVFKANTAQEGGAIYVSEGPFLVGKLSIYSSQFYENQAGLQAGAININGVKVNLTNCVFNANSNLGTNPGGAISNRGTANTSANLNAVNCTFTGNIASHGAGISQSVTNNASAQLTLQNCILANDMGNYAIEQGLPTVITSGGNISSDSTLLPYLTGNNDSNNLDPQLVDPVNYNFYPMPGSPCIDNGTVTGAPIDDITGNFRIGIPDKGAFEYETVSAPMLSAAQFLSISPNPASDLITTSIKSNWTGKASIQLRDVYGKITQSMADDKTEHDWMFNLNIKNLQSGMYVLTIRMGANFYTGKIIKI